ncbi:MAG: hypothetical protein M3389_03170, partial [Actinomycetota bacterium]|nr:hypothetical protein [Actinomycetota bacterium]
MRRPAVIVLATLAIAPPAAAQTSDPNCFTADPPPVTKPEQPLRFGITPRAAGSVGGGQANVAPEDEGKA